MKLTFPIIHSATWYHLLEYMLINELEVKVENVQLFFFFFFFKRALEYDFVFFSPSCFLGCIFFESNFVNGNMGDFLVLMKHETGNSLGLPWPKVTIPTLKTV